MAFTRLDHMAVTVYWTSQVEKTQTGQRPYLGWQGLPTITLQASLICCCTVYKACFLTIHALPMRTMQYSFLAVADPSNFTMALLSTVWASESLPGTGRECTTVRLWEDQNGSPITKFTLVSEGLCPLQSISCNDTVSLCVYTLIRGSPLTICGTPQLELV